MIPKEFNFLLDFHENIFKAAEQNDEQAAKFFVEEEGILVNVTDDHRRTPAHIAAIYGNLDVIKYLLEQDPSVLAFADSYGHTIFITAIICGNLEVVKYLVDNYEIINISQRSNDTHGGNTAIHFAAKHCRLKLLKYFIDEKNVNVNIENDLKETPVFSAAEGNKFQHMPVIEYLYEEKHADLTRVDIFGKNILYRAVDSDDLNLIKYVLDKRGVNLDPNWRDSRGNTLVHRAVSLKRALILDYLVNEKNADVNISNESGQTPLHTASRKNDIKICECLVVAGNASTKIKDREGKIPVERATKKEVIQYLEGVSQKRSRRSVFESRIQWSKFYQRIVGSSSPSFVGRLDNGLQTPLDRIFFFQFQTFLAVVSMIMTERDKPRFSFLTPMQIVQQNIDPIAIEVVHSSSRLK